MSLADTLYEELEIRCNLRGYSEAYMLGYMISILDACADMDENVAKLIQGHIDAIRTTNADLIVSGEATK